MTRTRRRPWIRVPCVGLAALLVAHAAPADPEQWRIEGREAIARANDSEYGLVAYVHSQDPRRIYRLSRALQYGMVAVNRTKVTGAPIPFGGTKQSGNGREGGSFGLEDFLELKVRGGLGLAQ